MTPNAEIVYETLHDDALREIICKADLILPDGAGVVLASKMLGHLLVNAGYDVKVSEVHGMSSGVAAW